MVLTPKGWSAASQTRLPERSLRWPPMGTGGTYRLVAHNTATASANRIHDDEVARRYGFGGGLVPGVDVYAYMTHPPADAWGLDWLARGGMRARFLAPVYEGDDISVVAAEAEAPEGGPALSVEVRNAAGDLCATGLADMGDASVPGAVRPRGEPASDPPAASPESLPVGTELTLATHRFHAEWATEYLAEVRENLALYAEARVAHPGWLLRDANYVLSRNVVLGPWIHVESVTWHQGLVHDGDTVGATATVTKEWEHKGHRFVELDVQLVANADRPVAHVIHTAIYRPRTPAARGTPVDSPG